MRVVIDTIVGYVFHKAEFFIPTEAVAAVSADPKDDRFLEAAIAGDADLIVSGDRHLLDLRSFRGTPIVTARDRNYSAVIARSAVCDEAIPAAMSEQGYPGRRLLRKKRSQ